MNHLKSRVTNSVLLGIWGDAKPKFCRRRRRRRRRRLQHILL